MNFEIPLSASERKRLGDPSRWKDLKVLGRDQARTEIRGLAGCYYVYVLCEPDGTPFYVGKGTGDRIFQHEAEAWNTNRVSHKLNLIRRIRHEAETISYIIEGSFGSDADAHHRERELISQFGRHDLGLGPLTNQLDGGEGAANPSAEVRARHAASLGGDAADPERRVANRFLASIAGGQDSIPIKPWKTLQSRAHLLRPSPNKPEPKPTARMAKAIAASAISNEVLLHVGAIIPRRLVVDGVECAIENGCGGDMIHAGLVIPVGTRASPLTENIQLTQRGLDAVIAHIGRGKLEDFGVLVP